MKIGFMIAIVIVIPVFSQVPARPKPSFEVASVKPSLSNEGYMDGTPGGRFIAKGIPLRMLIGDAYRVRDLQIIGGPGWLNADRWDIEARPNAEVVATTPPAANFDPTQPGRDNLMLQSLLEDRFQLKSHREKRDFPVYELAVAKGGSKIKVSMGVPPGRPRIRGGRGSFEAYEISVGTFVYFLSPKLDRIVVDGTNMKGRYDISLKWTPETSQAARVSPEGPGPPSPPDQPSIFTAIQEQLGLKLEATRSPVEVLVIDSVQKPMEN